MSYICVFNASISLNSIETKIVCVASYGDRRSPYFQELEGKPVHEKHSLRRALSPVEIVDLHIFTKVAQYAAPGYTSVLHPTEIVDLYFSGAREVTA